jgi:hypothetical protein
MSNAKCKKSQIVDEHIVRDGHYVKPNIIQKNKTQHFKSSGEVFSFGVGARFSEKNGVSIGPYAVKKTKKAEQLEKKVTEDIMGALSWCIGVMDKKFNGLLSTTSCGCAVMSKMVKGKDDEAGNAVVMEPLIHSKSGNSLHFMSAQLNSNAKTDIAHTEKDISYTLIGVPFQEKTVHLRFYFRLTSKCYVSKLLFQMFNELTLIAFFLIFVPNRKKTVVAEHEHGHCLCIQWLFVNTQASMFEECAERKH